MIEHPDQTSAPGTLIAAVCSVIRALFVALGTMFLMSKAGIGVILIAAPVVWGVWQKLETGRALVLASESRDVQEVPW